jgi:bis(5'-adenosyl)-triphosphatase
MTQKIGGDAVFGDSVIPATQIFLIRKNVFALVHPRPVTLGHVLVCSRRETAKLQDLTEIESLDLLMTAQEVSRRLQLIYKTQYEVIIENGKDAGQAVPHVHLHLMPKRAPILTVKAKEGGEGGARTEEDMVKEADQYRSCFQQGAV